MRVTYVDEDTNHRCNFQVVAVDWCDNLINRKTIQETGGTLLTVFDSAGETVRLEIVNVTSEEHEIIAKEIYEKDKIDLDYFGEHVLGKKLEAYPDYYCSECGAPLDDIGECTNKDCIMFTGERETTQEIESF